MVTRFNVKSINVSYCNPINIGKVNAAEQSVHLTLGILLQSQAVFYALSFFWLDGFAVPAPVQVTQTVRRLSCKEMQ